jgi:hypothetical protein
VEREYRSRQRQLLIAASIVALYVATFSVILEPDPVTHTKVHAGTYIWQVVPFALLTAFFGWRAFKVRLVTAPGGIKVYRVASREYLPWSTIRGFEIHDSTSGRIVAVVARRTNGRTVRLKSFWVGKAGHSDEAGALKAALEADQAARTTAAAVA